MNKMDFAGKKLLIVSSDSSDREFVKAAKEMGIYVVCCDRYTDHKKSPAKLMADEAWDIDYTDTEKVAEKCREAGINGVIAGYSEDRVQAACKISKAIGTPFYATEQQIEFTRNKRLFKEACMKHGIDVPKEYCTTLPMREDEIARIEYPVIVKPSDNGGRKGISICMNEADLRKAIGYASENSKNGEIVIEEYLDGQELLAVYTLSNGEISLSCLNEKFVSENEFGKTKLCNFVITPSRYYEQFLKECDPGIRAMLRDIGAENGVVNIQLLASNGKIKAFEMGYRVNGNNDFKVIRRFNDIDFLKMLISYSITGDMGDSLSKDDPVFSEYYCTYVLHLKGGTVTKLDYSKLSEKSTIEDVSVWRKVGDVILKTNTNAHKSGMIKFTAKTLDEIVEMANFIQENIEVLDENGQNMNMFWFDAERLR